MPLSRKLLVSMLNAVPGRACKLCRPVWGTCTRVMRRQVDFGEAHVGGQQGTHTQGLVQGGGVQTPPGGKKAWGLGGCTFAQHCIRVTWHAGAIRPHSSTARLQLSSEQVASCHLTR